MASESTQTYKHRNFSDLLSYYAMLMKNAMLETTRGLGEYSPFLPKEWVSTTYDEFGYSQTIVTPNPGYAFGQSILNSFQSTRNAIRDSLMTLFINYDDEEIMWQKDLNFNLINSYASASQSLQWYNKDTEEFVDMPEYWFTRGCWYEMLPMCTKGDYIKAWHANVIDAVEAVKTCRRDFQKFELILPDPYDEYGTYSTTSQGYSYYRNTSSYRNRSNSFSYGSMRTDYSTSATTQAFIAGFWNSMVGNENRLSALKNRVEGLLSPIWRFGKPTTIPEQNASTAKLKYVTYLASDIQMSYSLGKTSISTASQLSSKCGTYDPKAANLQISK